MAQLLKKTLYTSIIGSLCVLGLYRFAWLNNSFFEIVASYSLYTALKIQKIVTRPFAAYRSYTALYEELEKYKFQNEMLKSALARSQGLQTYNLATREVRLFAQRYVSAYKQLAQILLVNLDNNAHFAILDAGSNKSVKPDMVVVYKNCLIGRIENVYPWYSRVRLISDKTCKVPAYCASSGVKGIHEGLNQANNTRLSFVNHLQTIKDGDIVLSSGEGMVFPRGFALGFIKEHTQKDFVYTITIEPMVDFTSLEYCYILQKGSLENKK